MAIKLLDKIRRHLDRRIKDDIKAQLFGQSGGDRHALRPLQAENAGGEIHRAGQHARIDQRRFVIRAIGIGAPGVVFHAACALSRYPVGPGPAQACILDRLVRVYRDMMPRSNLDHILIVVHHALAIMPGHEGRAGLSTKPRAIGNDAACIGDVAGLYHVHAQLLVQRHRIVKLAFVIRDIAAGFVVPDQAHALVAGIAGHRIQIEVRGCFGIAEVLTMAEPVAIPALVPTFDQYAAEVMLGRIIDVLLRTLGGGAMARAFRPGPVTADHAPPNADVAARLEPADIAQAIGFVEIEFEIILHKPRSIIGNADRAPGGGERKIAHHRRSLRGRRQRGAEILPVGTLEPVPGVIDQGRFMEREVGAVFQLHGNRRVSR